MPDDDKTTDLHFPKAGVNVVSAFSRQPNRPVGPNQEYARTCPVGVNVRGYDATQERFRGGSRSGVGLPTNLPAVMVPSVAFVIQSVDVLTSVGADPNTDLKLDCLGYYKFDGDLTDSSGHGNDLRSDPPPAPTFGTGVANECLASGAGYLKPLPGLTDFGLTVSAWFFTTSGTGGGAGTGFGRGVEVGEAYRLSYRSNGANGKVVLRDRTGVNVIDPGFTLALNEWHHAAFTYDGATATLYVDGAAVGTFAHTLTAGWSLLTWGASATGSDFTSPIDEVAAFSHPLSAAQVARLYNSGSPPALFGEAVELSQSGRVVTLVAVSQGTVKVANPGDTAWTTPTNNTGETPALNYTGVMMSAQNSQKLFFVDRINMAYYDPATNSVETWTASAGTLPIDSDGNRPTLICTWRGRTVLSGLLKDPSNVFMSRVGDPFDFDYAPVSPSPADAVAFNTGTFGRAADSVTALVPFNDDVMIIGGDHSIYLMRGDPMAGGQIDQVTDSIGFAYGQAWCQDSTGTVYFLSNKCGVFSMVPGAQPVRISQPIEPLVQALDMGRNVFRMAFVEATQTLHLFVTWADEPRATTHYAWEYRTQAWWQDTFANKDHNPLCCVTFDGNGPDDRQLLIGCWDGYVRRVDPSAPDDDGHAIASEVWIGPVLTRDFDAILLKDLQGVLGEASGDVTFDVHVGDTAEQALASASVQTGTLSAGRNYNEHVRASGHAIYVRLASSVQWAMEAIRLRVATQGTVRRRVPPKY